MNRNRNGVIFFQNPLQFVPIYVIIRLLHMQKEKEVNSNEGEYSSEL